MTQHSTDEGQDVWAEREVSASRQDPAPVHGAPDSTASAFEESRQHADEGGVVQDVDSYPVRKNSMVIRAAAVVGVLGLCLAAGAYYLWGTQTRRTAPPTGGAQSQVQQVQQPAHDATAVAGEPEPTASASAFGDVPAADPPASEGTALTLTLPQDTSSAGTTQPALAQAQAPHAERVEAQVAASSTSAQALREAEARALALEHRVGTLEGMVTALESKLATAQRQAAQSASRSMSAQAVASDAPRKRLPAKVARAGDVQIAKVAGQSGPVSSGNNTAPSASGRPSAGQGFGALPLVLRGVFPPVGEHQQAWVLDGDHVRVVTVGDTIRGARVIGIDRDRVRTSAGDINGS